METQGLQPTDWELVLKARGDDPGAFDVLVDRHVDGFYRVAVMMVSHQQDAEDVVQETLMAVHQGLGRFEGRSSFKTWAIGILMKQAAQVLRKRGGRPGGLGEAEVIDRGAANAARQSDARMDLAGMLAKVSDEHREVLVLRELQGLSYEEIGQVLGLARGTVESRLHRAREALKKGLDTGV